MSAANPQFLKFIDENQDAFIQRLAEAVAIPSVSGDPAYRPDVHRMGDWLASKLESLGVKVEKRPLGKQILEGQELDLPSALLGELGNDPKKKTLLIYGHFDVQPASMSDGWKHPPFELTIDPEGSGKLFGRGSSDDKGPILGWLNVIEAHVKLGLELPVNLKMCFEGMEESGSEGLDELISEEKDKFFKGVDCVCISDNYWLNTTTPCLTYGLRGIAYFKISVSGPARDLHSGVFGATVHEPMTDLIHLMSKLVTTDGKILIPGLMDLVAPLTDEERKRYEVINASIKDFDDAVGAAITFSDDKVATLMGRMRYPSLSLHGIEGAFYGAGCKTVIPAAVHGKFSIRLVPNLTLNEVTKLVCDYVNAEFAKIKTKSKMTVEMLHGGEPWVADPNHYSYRAAHKATESVYGCAPDYTREGGSIPVTLSFADALKCNVLLLPMGRGDDGAHSTNEKLDTDNFIRGSKLLGSYLYELAVAE
ncbi:hypothetical protein NliqN6_2115 [Naganishia liquefaciens]|uniref:Peptidase M20 dimerisation domain-containing protein n=1 Tax=Naganishia liquefaciens TaxID=104408 RepID=A0A8H3TRS3_9TREE|nr:hypothetical protein NliqN6_2115 [Naganishia liquefaciens]